MKWNITWKKAVVGAIEGAAMVLAGGVVIGATPNWLGMIAGGMGLGAWRAINNIRKHINNVQL